MPLRRSAQTRLLVVLVAITLCGTGCTAPARAADPDFEKPAEFTITDRVVLPADEHFSLSCESGPDLNVIYQQPYEKFVHRTGLTLQGDSPDMIMTSQRDVTGWDTVSSGYWNGAGVRVYRIINGKLQLVRTDTVAEHEVSAWLHSTPIGSGTEVVGGSDRILLRDQTRAQVGWQSWWKRDMTYYVGVASVDQSGNLSGVSWDEVYLAKEHEGAKPEKNKTRSVRLRASDDKTPPPAPTGVEVTSNNDGTATVTWDAMDDPDVAGFVIMYAYVHPDEHKGLYFRLSRKPATPEEHLREGDVVVIEQEADVRLRAHQAPRLYGVAKQLPPRDYGFRFAADYPDIDWRLVDHNSRTGVAVPEALQGDDNASFLRYELRNGETASLHNFDHGSIKGYQPTLTPGKPYILEAWVRYVGDDPDATAEMTVVGPIWEVPENKQDLSTTIQPDQQWRKIMLEVTNHVPWTDEIGTPAKHELNISGDGVFEVDQFKFYRKDRPFRAIFDTSLYAEGRAANVTGYRRMWLDKSGFRLTDKLHSVHTYLEYARRGGGNPWLAFQHHLNEAEWRGLASFINEPYDPSQADADLSPQQPQYWARLRHRYGRDEPWLPEFDRIIIQVNNQPYYGIFNPWAFTMFGGLESTTGEPYNRGYLAGAMAEYCFGTLKTSDSWDNAMDRKMKLVVQVPSGDVRHEEPNLTGYGYETVHGAPSAGVICSALYNGGWDGPPNAFNVSNVNEGIFTMLNFNHTTNSNWARNLPALRDHMKAQGIWPEGAIMGAYEIGPGYGLPGPGRDRFIMDLENAVGKSVAAATATLDNILTRTYGGCQLQNYFMLKRRYYYWSSHNVVAGGGQAWPHWKLLKLWFTEGNQGSFLEVETDSVPTLDVPNLKRRGAVEDAPMAVAYATRGPAPDRYNVIVLSRKQNGEVDLDQDGTPEFEFGRAWTPVTLNLPFGRAEKVTLHKLTADPRANNLEEEVVNIETVENLPFSRKMELTAELTGEDDDGLPPACAILLVFEGCSQ